MHVQWARRKYPRFCFLEVGRFVIALMLQSGMNVLGTKSEPSALCACHPLAPLLATRYRGGGVFFDLSKHAQSRGQLAISLRLCSLVDVRSANHEWASKVVKHIHSTL